MTFKFAVPCVQHIKYFGDIIENPPVNLSLCLTFKRSKRNRYPDNEGKPAIDFYMVDGTKLQWVYDNTDTRNEDYTDLIAKEV